MSNAIVARSDSKYVSELQSRANEIRDLDVMRLRLYLCIHDYDDLAEKQRDLLAMLDPDNALERKIELNALRRVVPLKEVFEVKAETNAAIQNLVQRETQGADAGS